jgi:hypothetical protein
LTGSSFGTLATWTVNTEKWITTSDEKLGEADFRSSPEMAAGPRCHGSIDPAPLIVAQLRNSRVTSIENVKAPSSASWGLDM